MGTWMGRGRIFRWTAFLACALPACAVAEPAAPTADPLQSIREAYQKKDCKAVLRKGRPMRDSGAKAPAGEDRMWLNSVIVECAANDGDKAPMYQDALRATAASPSTIYVWRTRFNYEINQKDYDAALTTLELEAQGHERALNDLPIEYLDYIHRELDRANDKAHDFRLIKLMSTAYHPTQPFADIEGVRLIYARKLYDNGDKAAARDLINATQTFSGLMEIMADPEFSALQDPKVDLQLAAERQYVEDGITLSEHPDSLQGVIRVADDLRHLGRYQEAAAKLEGARARLANPGSFVDQQYQLAWWWNDLADTYISLGDYDRMVASFRGAIAVGEMGKPNVSQALNLSIQQIRFGHHQDALTTLATVPQGPGSLSPYGTMVYHYAHGCAAYRAGQKSEADQDVAYVIAHETDAPGDTAGLLLCVGDLDRAAASLIRQLENSEKKSGILWLLSDFRPNAPNVPEDLIRQRLPEIKKRADIRAAVAKAGGTQSYPFRYDDL